MKRIFAAGAVVLVALSVLLVPSTATADHKRNNGSHWNRNQPTVTAVAQVYFEDFSGPNWPVASSILKWDNRPNRLLPYYREAGTCNNDNLHCVPVRSDNYGTGCYGGCMFYDMSTNEHFQHGSVRIYYNTYYSYGDNLQREITCHELGHAMGPIGDGTTTSDTCMNNGAPYDFGPNDHDYNIIEDAYNH